MTRRRAQRIGSYMRDSQGRTAVAISTVARLADSLMCDPSRADLLLASDAMGLLARLAAARRNYGARAGDQYRKIILDLMFEGRDEP